MQHVIRSRDVHEQRPNSRETTMERAWEQANALSPMNDSQINTERAVRNRPKPGWAWGQNACLSTIIVQGMS